MRHKKVKLSAALFLGLGLAGLHAQEAIPATGGNALGSGGSVSYSVGQVVYTTSTGINGSVAQGVQQPYEISIVTGLEEAKGITLQCSVYPNPAKDKCTVEYEIEKNSKNVQLQILNMNGQTIAKFDEGNKIAGKYKIVFDVSKYANGTYIYSLSSDNNRLTKRFMISK